MIWKGENSVFIEKDCSFIPTNYLMDRNRVMKKAVDWHSPEIWAFSMTWKKLVCIFEKIMSLLWLLWFLATCWYNGLWVSQTPFQISMKNYISTGIDRKHKSKNWKDRAKDSKLFTKKKKKRKATGIVIDNEVIKNRVDSKRLNCLGKYCLSSRNRT